MICDYMSAMYRRMQCLYAVRSILIMLILYFIYAVSITLAVIALMRALSSSKLVDSDMRANASLHIASIHIRTLLSSAGAVSVSGTAQARLIARASSNSS
jgi:uncharacterized membrane protein YjgN (DUF898 family)